MNIKLVGILFAVGSLLACGDSGSDAGGGNTGGSTSGGSNPGGGTSTDGGGTTTDGGGTTTDGGGGAAALTCETGCDLLFECGLTGNPPLCAYTAADKEGYIPQCLAGCEAMPALLQILDPDDCPGNIDTVSTVNADFADFCENGSSQGGAGGGA